MTRLRQQYRRLMPLAIRRRVRRLRYALWGRFDPDGADADAHALRGDIARGTVRARRMGMDLHLDLEDGAARVVYFTGAVERPLLALLRSELRTDDVVADIGAHIGLTAVPAAQILRGLGGGRVHAFEASPVTARRLRQHVADNGVTAELEVVEALLLDRPGSTQLRADGFFGPADASTASLFGSGEAVTEALTATTFDAWADTADLRRLDVVKLDVEGAECAVIDGMLESLRRFRPRLVVVEEKDYLFERAGLPLDAVRTRLASVGYDVEGSVRRYAPRRSTVHDDANVVYRVRPS